MLKTYRNKRRSMRGFMLLDAFIALGLSLAIAASVYWLYARYQHANRAVAQATDLMTVANATGTYMTVNFTQLVNGTAVPGVANAYAPTIAELASLGMLPGTFSATNSYGGGYAIAVSKVPSSCVPPACDLASLSSLTNAITDPVTKTVDTVALGSAAQAAGGNAGYSTLATPGTISGLQGVWSAPNPAGNVAGILAMRAGYGSSGMAQFTRRDGSAPPTANWNMANYNVTGIGALGSTTITNSGAASVGGTLSVTGQTTTSGITNNGALSNNGNESVTGTLGVSGQTTTNGLTNNGTLTNTGNASVGGTFRVTGATTTNGISNTGSITNTGDVVTGRVDLQTIVTNGQACPGLNGYQAATSAGSIASCINGTWTTPNATTQVPPPCVSQQIPWGAGCSGWITGTLSGQLSSVTATSGGTGSATFMCSAGTWQFQSGTCSVGCNGTYTWGGGMCSQSYGMASGQNQTLNYSASGPVQAGGSYSGTATISCNNGVVSAVGTPTCSYTQTNPEVINSAIPSMRTQPTGVHLASNTTSWSSWCSAVLPGSNVDTTYTFGLSIGASNDWTCWGNQGYTCSIPPDGSICAGQNGCSCWNFANANGGVCYVTAQIKCTRLGT